MKCKCDMIQYAGQGVSSLTDDAVASVKNFVLSQLNDDGGFAARNGKSDLYYTVFGLQLTYALKLTPEKKVSSFLEQFSNDPGLDFVHLASLIRCRALLRVKNKSLLKSLISQIEDYRSSDGGYNHHQQGAQTGTVYAAFLAYLAYLETGLKIPDPDLLMQSLGKLKRPDGSFANDIDMQSGSTTATAAAVVLMHDLGENIPQTSLQSLLNRQHNAGGFFAGPASPVPDLLSTATSLFALKIVEYNLTGINAAHREFVASLWNEDGGFSGQVFDDVSDVEYTFYALLGII